ALFANLTVLPALLTLFPLHPVLAEKKSGDGMGRPFRFIRARARAVVLAALILGLGAAWMAPNADFDFDPMNLRDRSTQSVSTFFDLMADSRTSPYSITVLSESLDRAGELAARIDALDEVDEATTLADYVPSGQDEKLEIIGEMAIFLAPALTSARLEPADAGQRRAAMDGLKARLERLAAFKAGGKTRQGAERLLKAFSGLGVGLGGGAGLDGDLAELERRLLKSLPNRIDELKLSLEAGPVGLDDLPESLKQRQVAADGRARIEVSAKEDMRDREAMRRFVAAVRTVAPNATGSPVVILEAGNTVIGAFKEAAVLAVSLITVLLALLMGSVRDVLLVFAPLVLAALLSVAASVLLGISFNFANMIVLPLLFGLGVASGIHLVQRQRRERNKGGAYMTSTPRAVVLSALTTIGSFGSIALSSHPGTASMGVLLSIAITLTLACTMVVLPALMALGGGEMGERTSSL
ncbi:MAG: MMPL family transporter, partial [Rhodospirillales bacterium]